MNVMIDLCVVPMGVGASVSTWVAECERIIEASGLDCRLHPYGTIVEGEWDAVMAVVKRCQERMHELGAPRVFTTLKLGTRTDKAQTMDDKVEAVERLLRG